jgi:hypothetical protein
LDVANTPNSIEVAPVKSTRHLPLSLELAQRSLIGDLYSERQKSYDKASLRKPIAIANLIAIPLCKCKLWRFQPRRRLLRKRSFPQLKSRRLSVRSSIVRGKIGTFEISDIGEAFEY